MEDANSDEKVGLRKIRLLKPGKGAMAVVGSFTNADHFLTEWRSASKGWLKCRFEIEYLDEHVVKGEYRSFRGKDTRVSLSTYVRSTFRKMLKRTGLPPGPDSIFDGVEIQLWQGSMAWKFQADFLERYETEDFLGKR